MPALFFCFIVIVISTSCAGTESTGVLASELCPTGPAIASDDGTKRVALIVGVGQYKSNKIPDLVGPPQDAKRFYDLLTRDDGYRFKKQNVCMLLDADATTANFQKYFKLALIERVGAKDEAVIYYAGHGSQTADEDGDESDGMDETYVFHDARSDGIKDFPDDEFDKLLSTLYDKTQQITVFLDSCNSGTAMRGDVEYISRFVSAEEPVKERLASIQSTGEAKDGWVSSSKPGIVVFTAAGDGTSALEKNGRGIFTDAVLSTLSQINAGPLTYAQVARQIKLLVKAESYQIPYFQGDLQRGIFSGVERKNPIGWEITQTEPKLSLSGFPLPGIGKGAEFRVYDGAIDGAKTQDPAAAKAVIVVDEISGLNATARLMSRPANAKPIKPGDLAVLSRPGDQQRILKVTLRPTSTQGGISAEKAAKLTAALNQHIDAQKVINLVGGEGDFEISVSTAGDYEIRGPENIVRSSFKDEYQVINNLWQHSLQRVFSSLRGEGGEQFIDQDTLQVQIVPAKAQSSGSENTAWVQNPYNATTAQELPLNFKWNVKVKLSEQSPVKLLVGGLILSTDGSIFGFPADGSSAPLGPGEELVFASHGETFRAGPPFSIEDQIIVFGTYETNPVPWSRLTQSSRTRSADSKSGLYRVLDNYLAGTRGQTIQEEQDTAWTLSSINMKVVDLK